jgi:hypothetical protein
VNLRRVAPADWAVGLCGAVLIVSLWLPWYRGHSAWQAMAVNDVIFLIAGGIGLGVLLASLTQPSGALPIVTSVFAAFAGILASILAVVRLIWPPHGFDRAAGVWIGTAAALGLAVTAMLSMRDERRGVEGSTHVEITPLPSPRGGGA